MKKEKLTPIEIEKLRQHRYYKSKVGQGDKDYINRTNPAVGWRGITAKDKANTEIDIPNGDIAYVKKHGGVWKYIDDNDIVVEPMFPEKKETTIQDES